MSEASNYLENALINHVFRNSAYTSPTTVYVALFTAVSDAEAGTVTEVSGNNYSRKSATFGAPSNGSSTNSSDITFDTASGSWGTITHIGIYDASSSGNLLCSTPLDASKAIGSGDTFKIASGQLAVALA